MRPVLVREPSRLSNLIAATRDTSSRVCLDLISPSPVPLSEACEERHCRARNHNLVAYPWTGLRRSREVSALAPNWPQIVRELAACAIGIAVQVVRQHDEVPYAGTASQPANLVKECRPRPEYGAPHGGPPHSEVTEAGAV